MGGALGAEPFQFPGLDTTETTETSGNYWTLPIPWKRNSQIFQWRDVVIRHYSVRAQILTLRYVHSGGVWSEYWICLNLRLFLAVAPCRDNEL